MQIHLRIDGVSYDSWVYYARSESWEAGPELSAELFEDPAQASSFAEHIVALAKGAKANAVGVILHIGDEFATTELKPELDNPGVLNELRDQAMSDPVALFDDSSYSSDDHSWRLIPYPAVGSEAIATAVTLSKRADPFIAAIRSYGDSRNFPISVLSVSAPLVSLLALPEIHRDELTKPFVVVLPYPQFTILSFFNEHGDLQLLRTLQHRGQKRPSNLRQAASATAAALEMASSDIFVVPPSGEHDPVLKADLKSAFPESQVIEVYWSETVFAEGTAEGIPPEMLSAVASIKESTTPLGNSHTFTVLRDEGWALQDFLPLPPEIAQIYPERTEMKLLRGSRLCRLVLAVVALGFLAWTGLDVVTMIRQEEWSFKKEDSDELKKRLSFLATERQKIEHWDNLLADRSKAWANMEMLSRLFPENGGILIDSYLFKVSPEKTQRSATAGFVKQWRIEGLVRDEARDQLHGLTNRDAISAAFSEIAKITGDESFETDLTSRNIIVNLKTSLNPSFRNDLPPSMITASTEASYRYSFDLIITQRYEANDPLAVTTVAR